METRLRVPELIELVTDQVAGWIIVVGQLIPIQIWTNASCRLRFACALRRRRVSLCRLDATLTE